jgi:hypothetical protein
MSRKGFQYYCAHLFNVFIHSLKLKRGDGIILRFRAQPPSERLGESREPQSSRGSAIRST